MNFSAWTSWTLWTTRRLARSIVFLAWPVLAACFPGETPTPAATLDRDQAMRQEEVRATLTGLDPARASVLVGGLEARVLTRSPDGLAFAVPEVSPAGLQRVEFRAAGAFAEAQLRVFGDDVRPEGVTLLLRRDLEPADLERRLKQLDPAFGLERMRSLNPAGAALSSGHVCAGSLAEVSVDGLPLGLAIEQLEALEAEDPSLVGHIDPASDYGVKPHGPAHLGQIDHLGSVGARAAHERGLSGAGVLIAVLDTGVSPHPELGDRLRPGYNAREDTSDVSDGYAGDSSGHGTPVAVLAAGRTLGVAPGAEVLPLEVCDDAGLCRSSDVILGTCYALVAAESEERMARLVLNYSLGGDTEVGALRALLEHAIRQGALVAAAGGNAGLTLSPAHYPAASALPGLVAVGALGSEPRACLEFEEVPPQREASYGVGAGFGEAGVTVGFAPFVFANGESTREGVAYGLTDADALPGSGQALWTSNILATFNFSESVGGVRFRFADFGGNENVLVGDELLNVGALEDLPTRVGDVYLELRPASEGESAELIVFGRLERFGVGGQEFAFDDLCPLEGAEAAWQPADFSTRGAYLDVAAPGVGLTSGAPGGGEASYTGSSFATPLVAGALALWREARPTLAPADTEAGLRSAARALPHPAEAVGAGMLELSAAP